MPSNLNMTEVERWLPVVGYEESYEVSDRGGVRGIDRVVRYRDGRTRRVLARVLTQHTRPDGYQQVTLSPGVPPDYGVRLVQHLVLESFVGPRPPGLEALHGNDVSADNRLVNLRWGTSRENSLDCVANGGHHWANKTYCDYEHELVAPNLRTQCSIEGRRGCLACHRARSTARYRKSQGFPFDMAELREAHYARIMGAPKEQWAHVIHYAPNGNSSKVSCPLNHPLVVPNLCTADLANGRRKCLACSRARSDEKYAKSRGRHFDFQAAADRHYERIMSSLPALLDAVPEPRLEIPVELRSQP